MAKKKYYVVWRGHETGIYDSWKVCKQKVEGFPNAQYKSFESKRAAEQAFVDGPAAMLRTKKAKAPSRASFSHEIDWATISVDAACSGNPGIMEYQGVETKSGKHIFHMGPFQDGTNNIGEFLALVHALALLKSQNMTHLKIYSDSKIAIGWVNKMKCNTKLAKNSKNEKLFELIERAEKWLKENDFRVPVLKWETKKWGEIPADFGRK